ncbi:MULTISPECIES: ABC transporter permease [Aerococcus]|uniref:ABC transporter permease n=1 Tax=Aerococcus sanguinicola TaxID=119206 RepID=A0A5N1GK14_9LACT|nr:MULTISPECIES: ABC transporter permease [Aerococcus]KAA9300636.1 ABC transporter permease [Aerococcus sanguinicola]MDK6370121.1 ABC transporter permease [Aerococcus sp. UMB9870]MDK6680066.1 ABC transporter permease [Aerococcus sp. UMB8608]MDK6686227.1 ABC transporter permease [Aerococcus sp. UMB8623]MDK6939955.1 ABC transporter permease [Aerococcus sp. UMB8487]
MINYALKRILQAIPLLLLISLIVFSLIYIAPFDAIDAITTPNMTEAQVEIIREQNGLNDPFIVQYLTWLKNVLQGDFGHSLINQQEIGSQLAERIPNTLILMLPAYAIGSLIAFFSGLFAGAHKDRAGDRLVDLGASLGLAVPPFWLGLLVIYFFSLKWPLFPSTGMYRIGAEGNPWDLLHHAILPIGVLIVAITPNLTRYVRSAAISQVEANYITVQRSLGASKREIFFHHVSRNVLLPLVTLLGQSLPSLVTGAVVTESIFQWPGVGSYFVEGAKQLDYPVVMAVLLLTASLTILGNLLADLLYYKVDPRIRLEATS